MGVRRLQLVAVVAGGCLVLGAGTAGAGAPVVQCGATIVRSVTLRADLTGCPGTGLVIGADGVTVDLGGHTISGTNAPGSEGVAADGHAGVRVVSGRISDFRLNGVGIRGGRGSVVRGLRIQRIGVGGAEGEDVSAGILLKDSPGSQVLGNDVENDVVAYQSDGVDVLDSRGTAVQGNRLSHNNWNGLTVLGSPSSRVIANGFDANGNNGTEVNGDSDSVWIAANHADGNTNFGIVLGAASGTRVIGNSATGNDTGFYFFDLHNSLISANSGSGNREGMDLSGGQFGSDGNRLIGNTASGNREVGLALFEGANRNVLAGNVANGNQGPVGAGGGIIVAASVGNQLIGNVASANLDTGIAVYEDTPGDSAGNSFGRNIANGNAGNGIVAVAGTTDSGGNRASGNATEPQCQNIVCAG